MNPLSIFLYYARNRRKAFPAWLWVAIIVGCVLAGVLMGVTACLTR